MTDTARFDCIEAMGIEARWERYVFGPSYKTDSDSKFPIFRLRFLNSDLKHVFSSENQIVHWRHIDVIAVTKEAKSPFIIVCKFDYNLANLR